MAIACSFRVLRKVSPLLEFTDDELRKILVRAGGIRLTAGGQEVWGLLSRSQYLTSKSKLQQLKLLQFTHYLTNRTINSSSKRVAPKNWISHVTHQEPLSVCVQR